MTHKDIYTKFMIEYDKANVTSSYPSLTEYEVATFLDKAYKALIAQKVTGNNARRAPFEADVKSISDLQDLITTERLNSLVADRFVSNMKSVDLPTGFLYFVSAKSGHTQGMQQPVVTNVQNIKLVTHSIAEKFFQTSHNKPWIKDPVCFIENNKLNIVYDPMVYVAGESISSPITTVSITFVKLPHVFTKPESEFGELTGYQSCFSWSGDTVPDIYKFELNDTAAEELINLAITFALENVESQRLNTKLNTRGLEA